MYYFIRWRHTEEGYEPDLPYDVSFSMLAEPGRASDGAGFALFECDLPEEFGKTDSICEVPDELSELLDSAKDYPPALALTRDELKFDNSCSETKFANMLSDHLTHHLEKQINSQFFLAKAKSSEIGYRYAGGYYWIVGCKGEMVQWVSRDYHVYQDSVEEFELNLDEVIKRFEIEK
jgi:hypothetical protein